MNWVSENSGIVNIGNNNSVTGSAVGTGASVHAGTSDMRDGRSRPSLSGWDVGVVTILPEEMGAVVSELGLSRDAVGDGGIVYYTGAMEGAENATQVVATRTSDQGQQGVMASLGSLREQFDPAVLILVGIAGGIHRDVAIDDVVVATRVVYYDLRKVTSDAVLRRGREHIAPVSTVHAVNSFFTDFGQPADLATRRGSFHVHGGPIGSGEAVVADAGHEIRTYLTSYNDKTLAVDMEAGGLGRFCYETASTTGAPPDWVVIRGISDHADVAKDDDRHLSAALNAAHTLRTLIPYLKRPH